MAQEIAQPEHTAAVPPVPTVARPKLALGLVFVFVGANLAAHFITVAASPYGIHRDEFLYLAMGEHLRFWCWDFPPAIAVLANLARALFGDTLFAIRFFPAIAGTGILILAAIIARELGGGRLAQGLAMLTLLFLPVFQRPASLFHPVVLDQLCWTLGFLALIKISQSPQARWWWLLGVAGGLGLLTKFSIGFFALGVLGAIICSGQYRMLSTPWPYVALLVALLVGSASIIGQIRLGFPVLIHMQDLRRQQLERIAPTEFLSGQVLNLGPAILLAGAGLGNLLLNKSARAYRSVGWTCVFAFLILLLLRGKAYYIGPIYPVLFVAGAVALEGIRRPLRQVGVVLTVPLVVGWGLIVLPFGLPLVPPAPMAKYAAALGIKGATATNRGTTLPLPQDYADMLGWEEQVSAVARVYESLPRDQRSEAVLVARNYGEAGALEFFGPRYGLPQRILQPGNYLIWPPPERLYKVAIAIGFSPTDLSQFFRSVKLVNTFDHPWMVDEERNLPICIAQGPYGNLGDAWSRRRAHH
jgi:4-amino-4-deoxy-L-arabinose transferase-like glycosyltransferase